MQDFNIFNLIFILFIFIWVLYAFFILYHFIRFGIGRQPKVLAFWFLFGSFLFLLITSALFLNINWNDLVLNIKNLN